MSAFMVSDDVLSAIARALCFNSNFHDWLTTPPEALAGMMYEMNAAAVRARYEDADKDMITPFEYVSKMPLAGPALYKQLSCFLYQCSEGDVPEMELFKKMRQAQAHVAAEIISAMPAYERAGWGDLQKV